MDQNKHLQGDEIDLVDLLGTVYKNKKTIIRVTALFIIIGLLVALFSPVKYKAEITFVPQTSEDSGINSSSLSGLAALAGVNLGKENSSQIPPSLYPTILESISFNKEFLNATIKVNGESLLIKQYLTSNYKPSIVAKLFKSLTSKSSDNDSNQINEFDGLSDTEYKLKGLLTKKLLTVTVNEKEGFVTLSMIDSDPYLSALMGKKAFELLEKTVISFKIENAKKLYNYVSSQYESKQKEFEEIQKELALFSDQNKNIKTALFDNKRQRLQTKHDLSYSIYQELAKQKAQAELQVSKDTPIFSILNPITPPKEKNAPKRALILVIFTFLGAVLSVGYILVKGPIKEIIKQIAK